MKRILCSTALALLTIISSALAGNEPAKPAQPPLAGGYSPAEIDPGVRDVASFAVSARADATGKPLRLIKILKAERQVVAGLNFRLELEVTDGNRQTRVRAVVWKKLDRTLVLTSWDEA